MRTPTLIPYWWRLWRALSVQIQLAVALFASWWTLDASAEEKTRLLAILRVQDPMVVVLVTAVVTMVARAVRQAAMHPPAPPPSLPNESNPQDSAGRP